MTNSHLPSSSASSGDLELSLYRFRWVRKHPVLSQLLVSGALFVTFFATAPFILMGMRESQSAWSSPAMIPFMAAVLAGNAALLWIRSLRKCPQCRDLQLEHHTADDRFVCTGCSWREGERPDGEGAARERAAIASWKLLLPLSVPIVAMNLAFAGHKLGRVEAADPATLWMGLTFAYVGAWALVIWSLWPRTTSTFRMFWRPPSRATPLILGTVFVIVGVVQAFRHLAA